jgi:hypothetical protein
MKRQSSKTTEKNIMEAPNCLAIIAILTEMARCLNQNIAKVRLAPLDTTLTAYGIENNAMPLAGTEK